MGVGGARACDAVLHYHRARALHKLRRLSSAHFSACTSNTVIPWGTAQCMWADHVASAPCFKIFNAVQGVPDGLVVAAIVANPKPKHARVDPRTHNGFIDLLIMGGQGKKPMGVRPSILQAHRRFMHTLRQDAVNQPHHIQLAQSRSYSCASDFRL